MKPDRSNYESWFTDWLDGRLNEQDTRLLKEFLENNPDLRDELKGLEMVWLAPAGEGFRNKQKLLRKPSDLDESQFDYLCIASLENDITPGQREDLEDIISRDPARRKTYQLYQKIRLQAPEVFFRGKRTVKRLTTGSIILRTALAGLSSAAAILFFIIPMFFHQSTDKMAGKLIPESNPLDTIYLAAKSPLLKRSWPQDEGRIMKISPPASVDIASPAVNKAYILPDRFTSLAPAPAQSGSEGPDPLSRENIARAPELLSKIDPGSNSLRPYKPLYVPDYIEDTRSNVDRLVARFFHQKIMKDTIMPDRPIKRYELATAGIARVNKLLGWEMALLKNTDEDGNVNSYSFTSAVIKIKAPVRRTLKSL